MKKGKISYNSLIRSVLRIPFRQHETRRVGRDIGTIETVISGAAEIDPAGAVSVSDIQRNNERTAVGTTLNTTIYGGDGKEALAFYRGVNGAFAGRLSAISVNLSLTFPVETPETAVADSMRAFQAFAMKEKISITGGHTAFSDQVSAPVFTVSAAGIAHSVKKVEADAVFQNKNTYAPHPGDTLIVTNFVGDTGAWILCQEKKEMLSARFSESFLRPVSEVRDYLSVAPAVQAIETIQQNNMSVWMHDVSESGLYGALWEMAEGFEVGFSVTEENVPFHQETIEICNELDIDPCYLLSTGCLLISADEPETVLMTLKDAGIPAVKIGTVEGGHQKKIIHGDEIRNLDHPKQDGVMTLSTFG